MLTTGLVALTLLGIAQDAGTPDAASAIEYPDQSDVIATGGAKPNIFLLLDDSGSMNESEGSMECARYPAPLETKISQLVAALTGCDSAEDGVIDMWADRANFAIGSFNRNAVWAAFESAPIALETSVAAFETYTVADTQRGTPLAPGYQFAAEQVRDYVFSPAYQANPNLICRNNAVVVMSDGKGNSQRANLRGLVPRLREECEGALWYCGRYGVGQLGTGAGLLNNDGVAPVGAAIDYPGMQSITSYSVFFGADANAVNDMSSLASGGGGSFFTAENGQALRDAFDAIVGDAVNSARTTFSTAAVQNDGLISGNSFYVSSFRGAVGDGPWFGTTRRYCLVDSDTEQYCMYHRDTTNALVENTTVYDKFIEGAAPIENVTGEAFAGGSEYLLRSKITTALGTAQPYVRRLFTWDPDRSATSQYFELVHNNNYATGFDALVRLDHEPACDAHRLLNSLYGFTYNVADCTTPGSENYAPLAVDDSVIGDTMNGSTLALSYPDGSDSQTYVFTNANDGILHIYDGSTGAETAGLIPGDLWNGYTKGITRHRFWDLMEEAPEGTSRRFTFDGVMRLYHEDGLASTTGDAALADGLIQSSEKAFLLSGLGRGGHAYYLMDVSTLEGGVPTTGANPIYALTVQDSGHFANLLETWSAPWLGNMVVTDAGGTVTRPVVAAFPSGHDRTLDEPSATFGAIVTHDLSYTYDERSYAWADVAQANLASPLVYLSGHLQGRGYPALAAECSGTGSYWTNGTWACPAPESVGWAALDAEDVPSDLLSFFTFDEYGNASSAQISAGNVTVSGVEHAPVAYRVRFRSLNLRDGDSLVFSSDGHMEEVMTACSSTDGSCATSWIGGASISMAYHTSGEASQGGLWEIEAVEVRYEKDEQRTVYPSFYIVNADDWADTQPFERLSASEQDALVVARFSSQCGSSTNCFDGSDFSDLEYMTCPISAEPAVYSVGGVFRAAYFGDECGQIWKVAKDSTTKQGWNVKRLLSLNAKDGTGSVIQAHASKDYRKIFRKLELIVSRCTGSRKVGLYFGSGNIQIPSMIATSTSSAGYLGDSSVTNGQDVVGVVWDRDEDLTLADLHDVTGISDTSVNADQAVVQASNERGWYFELRDSEKALRDPVVLNGVAYFTTYTPTAAGGECSAAEGVNRVYAMNACTADADDQAIEDPSNTEHRVISSTPGAIGGGLTVFVPENGVPIAVNLKLPGSAADGDTDPSVFGQDANAAMKVRLWRTSLLD